MIVAAVNLILYKFLTSTVQFYLIIFGEPDFLLHGKESLDIRDSLVIKTTVFKKNQTIYNS